MLRGTMTTSGSAKGRSPEAVALFSGGLDSILAARLIMEQGLAVRCLHFVTPFFGKPECIPHWEAAYGLSIEAVDVGADFVRMLREFPKHGYGKVMNPCVDCKILMIRRAGEIMAELGASFLVSGEVLGQRPMSQRRDTLNVILREAGVRGDLLRPLCARHLAPTRAELSGLVDRSRLGAIFGRGRQEQLALAARMGLAEIPTPAGGCKLTEKENARRYWPVLSGLAAPGPEDFALANIGRQYRDDEWWLSMGRNAADNEALARLVGWREETRRFAGAGTGFLLRLENVPGPLAFLRRADGQPLPAGEPPVSVLEDAAALVASHAPRAVEAGEADVEWSAAGNPEIHVLRVRPSRQSRLLPGGPPFEAVKDAIRRETRIREALAARDRAGRREGGRAPADPGAGPERNFEDRE